MKRYTFVVLFFLTLIVPFILRSAINASGRPTSSSGTAATLVIISPHAESIRREFADAFSEWHQKTFGTAVYVDWRGYGGASDIVKFFDASKETLFKSLGTYKVDLVWGGGDFLFDQQLKKPGYLQGVTIHPEVMKAAFPKPDLNGVALYDLNSNPPQWIGTALSNFGIAYNRDVDHYLGVHDPKTWNDLKSPKYRGWLIAADPTRSASAKQAFMTIIEKAMADAGAAGRSEDVGWAEGMGNVRQILSNARMFIDSSGTVPSIISAGDGAVGMAIDFYGRTQAEAVGSNRMGYVEPAGETETNPDPIALVNGAEHRELAVQFIEYVLSESGQRLWNTRVGAPGGPKQSSLRRLPIMPSVYKDSKDFTDDVNPYAITGGFNKSNAREKTFGIVGELIQCSCINLLDDLRETRRVILNSPRAAELDARLGVFPFGQKEALVRLAAYKSAKPLDKLAMMRKWTQDFRDEYRQLREAAEQ